MTLHDLIFSDKRRIKIKRHIVFWLCWYLYIACTQLRNISPDEIGMKNFIIYQFAISANRLFIQLIFCYTIIYLLIPYFLQTKKYKLFITAFLLFLFGMYWITYFAYTYTTPFFRGLANLKGLSPFLVKYYVLYSHIHFTGSLVACTIMLVVKYYKIWYRKRQENEMLMNENKQAELQLLKAQAHPHFLFNTLNNIYSLALDKSPKAATTVKKLSGMMHYMTNEGSASFVPIGKEIKMMLDYVGLERIRYGERLEMKIDIQHNPDDHRLIAPLLMIPFVENCFKHGASKTIDDAWIHLFLETGKEWFEFKISNSKQRFYENHEERKKIGLLNVQKRLSLLYPGEHQLDIQSTDEEFSVLMKVKLQKPKVVPNQADQVLFPHKNLNYAR